MRALLIVIGVFVTGMAIWASLLFFPLSDPSGMVQADHIHVFGGVKGPSSISTVEPLVPTPVSRYSKRTASRLAILLTDPASNWLRLAHGLKTIGVPFLVTEDYRQALQHRVVLVYPRISGRVLSMEALKALAAFPRNGGTLIAINVLGGELNEVFGFRESQSSNRHFELRLNSDLPLLAQFTDPKEKVLRLGDQIKGLVPLGSLSFVDPQSSPLAVYEDGTAAITHRSYGLGQAIALGVDIGFLLTTGYTMNAPCLPMRERDLDHNPFRAPSDLNRILRQIAGRFDNVSLADAEQAFQAASAPLAPGFDLFLDYVHPTKRGNLLLAQAVYTEIVKRDLIGAGTSGADAVQTVLNNPGTKGTYDERRDYAMQGVMVQLFVMMHQYESALAKAHALYQAPGAFDALRSGKDARLVNGVLELFPDIIRHEHAAILGSTDDKPRRLELEARIKKFYRDNFGGYEEFQSFTKTRVS